ncbi:MAG: hypothetical protein ACTSYB_11585, partial [Candidatus Helarchaeota archaeon]
IKTVIMKEKTTWITKALNYSPEFEQKLLMLREKPKLLNQIKDPELLQFLTKTFTILSPNTVMQLDQMLLSENEKIEILEAILILSPEQRKKFLNEFREDQKEASN